MRDQKDLEIAYKEAVSLLKKLISIRSLSKEEDGVAAIINQYLKEKGVQTFLSGNNIIARSKHWDNSLPTILLNSHHDTVKPNQGYTKSPFSPIEKEQKLFGLGSNDAGGALVSLIQTFLLLNMKLNPFNLILATTAEEEISGTNGIASILPEIGHIDLGVVGEPTLMQMAVAEKGLMVFDCYAKGKSGHAARNEWVNAIYEAMPDIEWFRTFKFSKKSKLLGPVKMTVSQIEAGYQHNVVPDICKFVVDVRTTDEYNHKAILDIVHSAVKCKVMPRSEQLNPSKISLDHPIVKRGYELGLTHYGSPTLSDQALIPFTTIKIGPGNPIRSHIADEFIFLEEIREGIDTYLSLLDGLKLKQ